MRAGQNALDIAHPFQQFLAAGQVELAHYVVENEHGRLARKLPEDLRLGKLHGERRRARLSLRAVSARIRAVDGNFYVVAVRSHRRKPETNIPFARCGKLTEQFFRDLVLVFRIRPVHFEGELLRAVR